jgi:hypothetical protein
MSDPSGPADEHADASGPPAGGPPVTGPSPFAPMDGSGPTDEADSGSPSTAQFAPIVGGAAARLGVDAAGGALAPPPAGPPPGPPTGPGAPDDSSTQALGVVQPAPAAPPPGPGAAAPPVAPRPFDPGVTLDDLPPVGIPQWGPGPDGGPPTQPAVLDKTDEQPAVGWVAGGAAAGVVGADALADRGTGIRPPGAPSFQPPPPPPPGVVPPHPGPAGVGPGAPPPAPGRSGGKAAWALAGLLVLALVAVVVLVARGSSLSDDKDEADARADELASELDDLRQERDDLEQQIEDLQDEVDEGGAIPEDLVQLEEELAQRQAAIEALEDELATREDELDQREEELDQREEELDEREEGLGDLGGPTAAADLEVGDCIAEPIDAVAGVPEQVTVVDCATSHQGEVYALEDVGDAIGDAYPGQAVLLEAAVEFCGGTEFDDYFGGTPTSTGILPTPRLPPQAAWDADDRTVVCAGYPADGVAVTGSQAG